MSETLRHVTEACEAIGLRGQHTVLAQNDTVGELEDEICCAVQEITHFYDLRNISPYALLVILYVSSFCVRCVFLLPGHC